MSVLCRSAIPVGAAWPMMAGGPRPGCAAVAPGPGCSRQPGRQVLGGGVAEKAAASLGMGGEYSHILPRALPGYRKTWRWVLWNPGQKLSGTYAWLSKFQVFINLVLNETCGILRIGRTIRIHVRRCSRCLARRRKAAGRAAETWEARCRAGSHPAPPANFERGGGVDAEGTEEYLEAQVRHRRSA